MKVVIACDHGGYDLKQSLISQMNQNGLLNMVDTVKDLGTNSNESVDYPNFAHALADFILQNPDYVGVLICGSGIGISIAANRHKHIRCALVCDPKIATITRQHNDSNVIALGARFIEENIAIECVKNFLTTKFEGGRHQCRVDLIDNF